MLILDQRIKALDQEIETLAANDPVAKRLQQLRGVGPMIATALLATVGDASQFNNGRQMAASLGLTPKQNSSAGPKDIFCHICTMLRLTGMPTRVLIIMGIKNKKFPNTGNYQKIHCEIKAFHY